MLRMQFLGAPSISFADEPLTELNQAPLLLNVFAFLVIHRHQPQARSVVAGTFWPELAEARARRTLNNALWRLRNALGGASEFLLSDNQTVQFDAARGYWLDVEEFAQRTQALLETGHQTAWPTRLADFERGVGLYRGDFLTGIDADWSIPLREQWRERYLNTLEQFANDCQSAADLDRALQIARQLASLDAYRESTHQRLIELYLALHRPGEACTQFEEYKQMWRVELHLSPSAHMLALAQRYQLDATINPPVPTPIPLGADLAQLLQAHPAYVRRQLEICYQNDDLFDLMAERQRQTENLLVAQTLAEQLDDPVVQLELFARRAWLATRQGEYTMALTLAQTGLEFCEQHRQTGQRAWLHRLMGVTSEEMGNFSAALHHYTKALQSDEAHNVVTFMPANLNNVAATQLTLARYWVAIQALERAQMLLASAPAPRVAGMVMGNLGYAWLKLGQVARADGYLQPALTLAQRIGDRGSEWWLAALVARLYHLRGETARALTFALHHYTLAQQSGDAWVLTYLADTLALLYADSQAGEASLVWAQRLQAHAAPKQQWRYQVRSLLRLAQAQHLLAHHATAFDVIEQAIIQYRHKKQTLEEEPELFATYAQCAAAVGQPQIAGNAHQQSQQALQVQLDAISDPALRQSFLCVQRYNWMDHLSPNLQTLHP